MTPHVIGLDFGTDSCRALVVNAVNGEEIALAVAYYSRWKKGLYCDISMNQYRQHPLDYIEAMEEAVCGALQQCAPDIAATVVGMSFDTTGSTPVLLDKEGTPLALRPEFAENPNAMFVLWKDHTALAEANEINELSRRWTIDYTTYSGGAYSSEWVWAKMLHVLRVDPTVRENAYSWAEHCDWMPALLTGRTSPEMMIRSRCAAGHKAMWNEQWGGLPSSDFLETLDPLLNGFRDRLYEKTYTTDTRVGYLTPQWAERLGLNTSVAIGVGAIDCHVGAVGVELSAGTFVKVIGTSTCDIMIASRKEMTDKLISGICGQVDGSVLPDYIGLEAGQSAFGDLYAWFKDVLVWPIERLFPKSAFFDEETRTKLMEEIIDRILPELTAEAEKIPVTESALIAVDWMNGRRTPYANGQLSGSIVGLTLGSSAPHIFKALVEATAFGSKAIVECFRSQGIPITRMIGIGGISLKSPFVMQTLADVLGMPIGVAKAEQACALGAAMFAAVVAGVYPTIADAQQVMGKGFIREYIPDTTRSACYQTLYARYLRLGQCTEHELATSL